MERFRAGFKHLFRGSPAVAICVGTDRELTEYLIVNSTVDVPDTATCWLCLAVQDHELKQAAG